MKSTPLEEWIKKNQKKLVEIAEPKKFGVKQRTNLTDKVTSDVSKGIGYDIGGLFGFLHKKFRKLNSPKMYFCSEYWMVRLKEVGKDILPTNEKLESPQDVLKAVGDTLVSIQNKVAIIESKQKKGYRRILPDNFESYLRDM